jgi:hypothetical protein
MALNTEVTGSGFAIKMITQYWCEECMAPGRGKDTDTEMCKEVVAMTCWAVSKKDLILLHERVMRMLE